jgi:hypothetical protein
MPGPKTEIEALRWARKALAEGWFIPSRHYKTRCRERGVLHTDVHHAIALARSVEAHESMPKNGGTCWRIYGSNVDGTHEIGVGIEAFTYSDGDEQRTMIIICTVLPPREKS